MKKIFIPTLLSLLLVLCFTTNVYAASIGDQLIDYPEEGWQRFDEPEIPQIVYSGSWSTLNYPGVGYYKGTIKATKEVGASLEFKFYGTKIRIIDVITNARSNDSRIVIDGIEDSFSTYNPTRQPQTITYEKLNLNPGIHNVKIYTPSTNVYSGSDLVAIDAIDIDESGNFVNINTPLKLHAVGGDSQVTLDWDKIDPADSYIVHYGTESGNYTETATVTKDTYGNFVIPGLTNGTTYYFVVSAVVNGVESDYSNEASATPQAVIQPEPEPTGDRAILTVTLTTGLEKEYDLPMNDVESFLDWYDAKDAGNGPAKFAISKYDNNKGPFSTRTDYIIFNSILTFEISEYSQNQS